MAAPLSDRIRPATLDEIIGQKHLFAPGAPLRRIVESGASPNLIFYGPPGTGKTTAARIIAAASNKRLCALNGTTASLDDVRRVIAQVGTVAAPNGVLLYLDEIQYFNKKQQQSLLQYIENGDISLIASTTENPFFYIYNAVLSRSTVFEFKPLSIEDAVEGIDRAFRKLGEEFGAVFTPEEGVREYIASASAGDMRRAITLTELTALASPGSAPDVPRRVTLDTAKAVCAKSGVHYDRQGDDYYDMLSAYQKSMRGSDPDAAVYYLARILAAGDLPNACRRLLVCANEDVGLAYPMIIPIVKAAVDTAMQVGLPEARIPLANAVILVATSPKSNSAYNAVNRAFSDVERGRTPPPPRHLQNKHFDGEDAAVRGQHYLYPHDYPGHWTAQQYLPDDLAGTVYYVPGENKNEQAAKAYADALKKR